MRDIQLYLISILVAKIPAFPPKLDTPTSRTHIHHPVTECAIAAAVLLVTKIISLYTCAKDMTPVCLSVGNFGGM